MMTNVTYGSPQRFLQRRTANMSNKRSFAIFAGGFLMSYGINQNLLHTLAFIIGLALFVNFRS